MLSHAKERWGQVMFFLAFLLILLWKAPNLEFYLTSADHGYQLSLGQQVLMGKFPFRDLFFHYGPLTALTSAFGLRFSDSLIPETVICATGYAAAIFIIHHLARCYVSTLAGYLAPILGFLFLARFYKWYYWLLPLLALYFFHVILNSDYQSRQKWLCFTGVVAGIGGLYRLDLGIAMLCFHAIMLLGMCKRPLNVRLFGLQFRKIMVGFLIIFLFWILSLWWQGGAVQDYFSAILTGGRGVVERWSLPIPNFDVNHPLSRQSGAAVIFILMPLTYILCLLWGGWNWICVSRGSDVKYKFMVAVGILGLGILPQAFYRADVLHLLQVIPPVLIGGSLVVSDFWKGTVLSNGNFRGRLALKIVAGFYLVTVGLSCWGIRHYGGSDLAKFAWNPIPRYHQLSQGIHSGVEQPVIRLIAEVRRQTMVNEKILVVPLACQLYYFADRPMSGLLNGYALGILDTDLWRRRNLDAIMQDPPKVVIVTEGFFSLPPTDMFRESQPELYDFLARHYARIIYHQDGWMLLTRTELKG